MKIELTELGEGQFVEIKNPKVLSWGQQKKITSAMKDESMASQLDVAEVLTLSLVKGGYVLDENNQPVAFPLTTESIEVLPALVIEKVAGAFAEARAEATSKN
jgi:hypothetical protein